MEPSAKTYYQEIDTLKGIAIFFVVLAHSMILYPVNLLENVYCNFIFCLVSSTHMILFFIVSGFCFSFQGNYLEYIRKRIFRLLIPYIVFNLADMLPRQLLPALVNRPANMMESITDMLFYGGEYWFLYTLFIISLLYPVIYSWQKNGMVRKAIVELMLLALYFLKPDIPFLCLGQVLVYLFFYNTGVLIKEWGKNIFTWNFKAKWMLPVASALSLILWAFFSTLPNALVVTTAAGIMTCYLFTKFRWFNTVFHRFGKYSLQLYLLNGFLLVISRTLICKVTVNPVMIIGFNMLVTFFLSYLFIKYFCSRFKWIRKLMGM